MSEFWIYGTSEPHQVANGARAREAEGWDGIVLADSQNLRMDCFVSMTIAAMATETLKVSPGVSNPVTGLSDERCNWSDTPSCVLGGKDRR